MMLTASIQRTKPSHLAFLQRTVEIIIKMELNRAIVRYVVAKGQFNPCDVHRIIESKNTGHFNCSLWLIFMGQCYGRCLKLSTSFTSIRRTTDLTVKKCNPRNYWGGEFCILNDKLLIPTLCRWFAVVARRT